MFERKRIELSDLDIEGIIGQVSNVINLCFFVTDNGAKSARVYG
jgi:hypothetical protein